MSFRQDGNEICVKYEQQTLVVKAIRDDIVNIFVPYRTKEHYSKAIDGDKAVATELTAEQKGEDLVIATDKIRMQFGKSGNGDYETGRDSACPDTPAGQKCLRGSQ